MIERYVEDIAAPMRIELSKVSLVDGKNLGCKDVHLLDISSNGQLVSTLIFQSDLDTLQNGSSCDRLELKIRAALSRLQTLLAD